MSNHVTGVSIDTLLRIAHVRWGGASVPMTFSFLDGWWTDAGTFESLLRAGNLVAQSRRVQPAPRVLEKVNA